LIEQFSDATLAGDVNTAKLLVATLSDRKKLPVSWLYFHENLRPMYVGTWTKTSTVIGPRSPFAKEEGIDYAYDSGEDWYEDEEEGEEMEDLDTIDGEEEEEEEEDNGDWMIDDEEEELEQEEEDGDLVLSLDEIGSGLVPLSPKGKRKADNVYSFKNKRRKLATLKPDCKGPFWETTLGEARLPSFSRYAVRVLNGILFLFLSRRELI
jgi:chromatin assembly factor 1 subunit A